ncbi:MAG: hypothetical protein MR270_06745 [Erysipelotrichaceae bacterium]|nr:hypothetical protein [Erysipelotrichaceae bacterium]
MLDEIQYMPLSESEQKELYGKGAEAGLGMVTVFGVIAILTIVVYKLYTATNGDITLPGGFKFKFTT